MNPSGHTPEELRHISKEIRKDIIRSLAEAGSGHTGGSLGLADIFSCLYFGILNHRPDEPGWPERDRLILSIGHVAPVLYASLAHAGYFHREELLSLRKLGSRLQGHPGRDHGLPGLELSAGSLGQGLSVAVGMAMAAKMDGRKYHIFSIHGDGELQEGSIWEAAMSASQYKLENLTALIDRNGLQIDGPTKEIMSIAPLSEKYKAFGWNVIEIDGHNMTEILRAFEKADTIKAMPTVIIANTVKGKGVTYAENVVGYHGVAPKGGRSGEESLDKALEDIDDKQFTTERVDELLKIASDYQNEVDKRIQDKLPKFSKNYWWNSEEFMKVEMVATRVGFGNALEEIGEDKKIITHGADITSSIKMDMFFKNHPERKSRFFSVGVAEANMVEIASGFAREDKIAFVGSYGVFATGRAWDQIRTTVCYNNFNVKIANAHGGISVGPDGATHQALEEIAVMNYIPNMVVTVPCDSAETYKITKAIAYLAGPAMVRYARGATPSVTTQDTPFKFGMANVIRYRGIKNKFIDAFDWQFGSEYKSEGEEITIIACGPMVTEAMRAAYILKEECGIEVRIIDVHTIKPIDTDTIVRAAEETNAIITCEEHQVGGFGNIVAGVINMSKKYSFPLVMDMVGIEDVFGESGAPWELMINFELVAENIVVKANELIKKKM